MALIDTKKNSVLFKYGALPTAVDVVNIEDNVLISPDIKQDDFKEFDGELGNTHSYIDDEHTTASFTVKAKLRGNDKSGLALDTPPAISDLLKASGLSEAVVADTSVTYTPNHGTLTPSQALVYVDGRKRLVDGIVCDFKLSGEVGSPALVEFSAKGYTDIADVVEANPTVTLDKEALIIVNKVSAITEDGSTFDLKSFEFSLNNEIVDIYAVNIAKFERVDFDPKISLTGYRDSADSSSWVALAAQTLKTIIITLGTGAGKTVTLTIDSARPLTNSESNDSGKLSITKEYRCVKDATSSNHFELMFS